MRYAMMAFGPFAFGLATAAYDQLQRQMQFKHAAAVRVGARDAIQTLGPGSESLTLSGVVAPEFTGTLASITQLEEMGREGLAYVYLGYWIEGSETMDYKARFQPLECFDGKSWRLLEPRPAGTPAAAKDATCS